MDKEKKRQLKKQWQETQRTEARAAFPLPDEDLEKMFAAVETRVLEEGCDQTLRYTRDWLKSQGHPARKVIHWLKENGGFCDCEAAANSYQHFEENRKR